MTAITARIKDAAYYARKGCRTTTVDYAHIEDAIAEAMAQARAEGFVEGVEAGRSHLRKRACEFEADDMRATARHFRESADVLLKLTPPRPAEGVRPLPPGDLGEALAKAHVPTAEEIDRALAKGREDRRAFVEKAGGFPAGAVAMTEPPKAEATASEPPARKPVCDSCNDTHVQQRESGDVMCTRCPTPCQKCRSRLGAYCQVTPCTCVCHVKDKGRGPNATEAPALDLDELERTVERVAFVRETLGEAFPPTLELLNAAPELIRRARERDELRERLAGTMSVSVANWRVVERAETAERERDELRAKLNTPHTADFVEAVRVEAAHQRERWGSAHDAGKTDADWFWLIGYLAGKALHNPDGDDEKQLHRIITIAAAAANWHAAKKGLTDMRPGIDTPAGEAAP